MVIAGIVGHDGKVQTANLISSILSSTGKKVSVIDSRNISEMNPHTIRDYIHELTKNSVDILVLKLDIGDVNKDAFDHIRFDYVIYTEKADVFNKWGRADYSRFLKRVFSLLTDKGIAIINIDDNECRHFIEEMKYYIVTYGFSSKANITTSSVGDNVFKDGIICCLQRKIPYNYSNLMTPHEYRINIESENFDTHNVLAAASFAIVNGVDLNLVDNFYQNK